MIDFLQRKYYNLVADKGEQAGKPLSLRHNFYWNFVGNIVYAACQWGMLVVLAKLTSPEQVGLFALGLAITAPIFLFSQLQLRGIQATDAREEYQFGHYLGLRLITTVFAFLILIGVIGFSNFERTTVLVILAVGLSKAFESVADVFYGLLQRNERMDRIARSLMIKGPLALCLLAVIVYATGDVAAGALGLATAWGIVLIVYDLRNASKTLQHSGLTETKTTLATIHPSFDLKPLLKLSWLALPLGLTMAFLSLNTNIPRYFIEQHLGIEQLGYFAALAYLMIATNTVAAAMGQACLPRLAKHYAERDFSAFKKIVWKLIGIGALIGVGGAVVSVFFGRWLLTVLYNSDYATYSQIFTLLMLVNGITIVVSFLGYSTTAIRCFKVQVPFAMMTAFTTLIAAYFFIPKGLNGVVLTLLVSNMTLFIFYSITIIYSVRKEIMWR